MRIPFSEKKGFRSIPPRIGIALGGGGARGLAHLGVLKALEEAQIPIHCISGTSAGAIIGAMYAQNPDAEAISDRIKESIAGGIHEKLQLDCLNTKDIHWSDFSRVDELIEAGMISAQEKMFEIKKAMRKVRPWYKRFPFALEDRKVPPQQARSTQFL